MGDILRNWIQARLGILIDLTPEVFGHYTRDGSLLAQILHSYDVISRDQLDTIVVTQDPALCRVNLKHLRFWLRFVGIDCDDESIEEISCGKGTTSLRLFYKLYLCLETKDRLHFVTLQKEREKFVPTSKKFEVTRVSECPPPYEPADHPLSRKLAEGKDVVEWHRGKFPTMLRKFEQQRRKLEASKPYTAVQPVVWPEGCANELQRTSLDARKERSTELDRFAAKHRVSSSNADARQTPTPEDDENEAEVAETYVERLKNRRKRAGTANAVKSRMRKALLSGLWERMAEKQERTIDEAIARRVLDQSTYEKRIVTKLCEVREQKNTMAENQKVVEDITLEANEVEHRASYERAQDLLGKREKDVEAECRRMCELRHRLLATKIQKIREKHWSVCRKVVDDLASIALNVGDHRRVNHGRVPLTLLSEWKTLFLKSQPIFDEEIPYETTHRHSAEDELEVMLKSDAWTRFDEVDMLRDALFEDYLEANPPWDVALPTLDEHERESSKLGRLVLGYVVHRLLEGLYARPQSRSQMLLPRFKHVAIVLGIGGSPTVYESIRALLDPSEILTVRIEDAINHCLARYKQEMSDVRYIDSNIVAATAEIVQEIRSSGKRISCATTSSKAGKRSRWIDEATATTTASTATTAKKSDKDRDPPAKTAEEESSSIATRCEKETQTPRNIPYDDVDPLLTDSAYMGKWAYEFLALGEPIPNELATKILIEYMKSSLSEAKAWVLVDYPNTYEQMSRLETALTGSAPPPDPKSLDFDDITVEDIEAVTPRIVFEDKSDPHASSRQSRLVPDPIAKRNGETANRTFATLFVRVEQQPKYFETGERDYEPLKDDAPSIDKFYASRKIAHVLYYSSLDPTTLKKLARLVIGEPLQKKPSEELFGDALRNIEREAKRPASFKTPVVRRLLTEKQFSELERELEYEREHEREHVDAMEEEEEQSDRFQEQPDSGPVKPGEPNWQWIDLPLPSVLLETLAKLWEGLEEIYVGELKELLFLKSVHASSVVPYTDFLTRNAWNFIKRPDNKQDLLHRFHQAFNAIDEDARNDTEVKCELHRRVADFQTELWEICDHRRRAAEEERRRYVADQWTVHEAVILFNVYIGIVQAEIDRCLGTIRLLQDYYSGMTKRSLPEAIVSKVILNKIQRNEGEDEDEDEDEDENEEERVESPKREEPPPEESPSTPAEKRKSNRTDRRKREAKSRYDETKGGSSGRAGIASLPPAAIDRDLLRREIDEALLDKGKAIENIENVCLFKGITENVRYARGIVDALSEASNEAITREEIALSKSKDLTSESADSIVAKVISSRGHDLISEWRYANAYEIERVRMKLDSIVGVARLDVAFLLETLQRTFHEIYDSIVDRYWREMNSVNEMANVFCFAIEEGRMLEKEILLEGDRFVVRSNVYVIETKGAEKVACVRETATDLRFRIAHLARLMEIFKRVAPYGTMCERTLVYILEDLATHGHEEGETTLLPCAWYRLGPTDISDLVGRLFGSVDYVDWREFLVYGLDLPIPSCREILIARDRFRIQDPDLKETVTRAQYQRTPLWFLECTESCANVPRLLPDGFQRNREELYEEELYHLTDAGGTGSRTSVYDSTSCYSSPEETLRRTLAKELLCRMYTIDRDTVNYTALLLAFCKDENPRDGFGKALALALGNRVCTDLEEGERYVEELLRRKRRARGTRLSPKSSRRRSLELASEHSIDSTYRFETGGIVPDPSHEIEGTDAFELTSRSLAEVESISSDEEPGREYASAESMPEGYLEDHEAVVYWISLDLCLAVLAAALPWHVLQPKVTGGDRNSLRETLVSIYQQLWDVELNDEKDTVLAHRLLNHDFMKRLLDSVGKFTAKNIGITVQEVLRAGEPAKSD